MAPASEVGEAPRAASAAGSPSPAAELTPPSNVRVNNPAADHREDQTTQSETTVAVSGTHIAVGYNDSQQTRLRFTAGTNLNGYGYSTDGGKTFTDGGVIPNAPGAINLGDPWLGSGRSGAMYYASLVGDDIGNVEISVARSADGGQSWRAPVLLGRHPADFYFADKEALTVGRDPAHADRDIAYAAWDDFDANETGASSGLPVAHSSDGGKTWKTVYADQITLEPAGCSFAQYIGAQPLVVPADGTLYVAAEKIEAVDPDCVGAPITFSQVIFKSSDGGDTFGPGRKISSVSPAGDETGALIVGPGQVIRTIEFPTLAILGKTLYAAWNDGGSGHSHIVLAKSSDRAARGRGPRSPRVAAMTCSRPSAPTSRGCTCSSTGSGQAAGWSPTSPVPHPARPMP